MALRGPGMTDTSSADHHGIATATGDVIVVQRDQPLVIDQSALTNIATGAPSDPHLVVQEPLIATHPENGTTQTDQSILRRSQSSGSSANLPSDELKLASASANLPPQQATAGHTQTITVPLSLASQLISKATWQQTRGRTGEGDQGIK